MVGVAKTYDTPMGTQARLDTGGAGTGGRKGSPARLCGCWAVNSSSPEVSYLDGADHGAEGKHGGRVPQGGLAVKGALRVHQQHRDLRGTKLLSAPPASAPRQTHPVCHRVNVS